MHRPFLLSRFLLGSLTFSLLLVLPGCKVFQDPADRIIDWFSGKDDKTEGANSSTSEDDTTTLPPTSILEDLPSGTRSSVPSSSDLSIPEIPLEFGFSPETDRTGSSENTVPPSEFSSEKETVIEVPDDVDAADDASDEDIPGPDEITYWADESNLVTSSDGRQETWQIHFQKGRGFSTTTEVTEPGAGIRVTVLLTESGKTETLTGTTASDGIVRWTRTRTKGAAEMFLQDVKGDVRWDPRDAAFWKKERILSRTAEQSGS